MSDQTTARPTHQLVTWFCEHCQTRIAPVAGEDNRYSCECGRSRMRVRMADRAQDWWIGRLISEMRRNGGNLARSCDLVGITRMMVYRRMETDESLRLALDSIRSQRAS